MVGSDKSSGMELSGEIKEVLPIRVDRRRGAEIISRYFFPISPRTLEVWPVAWRHLNGRALVETSELLHHARERLAASVAIKGGRRRQSPGA